MVNIAAQFRAAVYVKLFSNHSEKGDIFELEL